MRSQADRVSILVGGGTQINEELRRVFPGYRMVKRIGGRYHGDYPTEIKTAMDRVAYRVLIQNREDLLTRLAAAGIKDVVVMIPVIQDKAGVLCHVDGDIYATGNACNGYDRIIIVTYNEATKTEKLVTLAPWIESYPGKFEILSPADITALAEIDAPTLPASQKPPASPPPPLRPRRTTSHKPVTPVVS